MVMFAACVVAGCVLYFGLVRPVLDRAGLI